MTAIPAQRKWQCPGIHNPSIKIKRVSEKKNNSFSPFFTFNLPKIKFEIMSKPLVILSLMLEKRSR